MNRPADSHADMTPGERLALTRREIVGYMKRQSGQGRGPTSQQRAAAGNGATGGGSTADAPGETGQPSGSEYEDAGEQGGTWQTIKRTAQAWWRSHPSRLALEVAEPVLQKYARAHPVKLLAIAAGVGAVVVLAKPWRLVSITGLLVAALKSSQLSGMAASFMSRDSGAHEGRQEPP